MEDGSKITDFSEKVYQHFGLNLPEMKEKGQEHSWGICKKEDAAECTRNMAGFGMEESQQIIIDFDKDYEWVLVRRYRKGCGTSCDVPQKPSNVSIPVPTGMAQ